MKEKILELRELGHSYNFISKKLNCSKSTVSYHCSKKEFNEKIKCNNVIEKNKKQIKNKSFLIKDYDVDKVLELRKNDLSYSMIKKKTKIPMESILKICKTYLEKNSIKYHKLNKKEIKKIKDKYEKIKSIRGVQRELGYARETIRKYVDVKKKSKMTNEEKKKKTVEHVINWRKRKKIELINYKGGKCEKCDYDKCINALEFHHLDPNEKDFSISGKSWSIERLKKEVDKCILLCANCHREIHSDI